MRLLFSSGTNVGDSAAPGGGAATAVIYSRKNPYPARLVLNRRLNGEGSLKDTRHLEVAIDDGGLEYVVGDALAVQPCNDPELVELILASRGFSGGEIVPGAGGGEKTLRAALLEDSELGKFHKAFLKKFVDCPGRETLKAAVENNDEATLRKLLRGHDVLDLLEAHPEVKFDPVELIGAMKKLMPRMYSIASSPKAHPNEAHLTVALVRYEERRRVRSGVASSYLAERAQPGAILPVFIHHGKHFRLPADGATPIIMVGAGTGIAPFRAYLEERRETGATGKNWLFFGDQRAATDFLYGEELLEMRREGFLSELELAFSRDQVDKLYVQHRMAERGQDLFAWLESGAHFYVCGDASKMAGDVHQMLISVVEKAGGMSPDSAAQYVQDLEKAKRYQKDVY